MKKRLITRYVLTASILITALALGACGKKDKAGGSSPVEDGMLRIAINSDIVSMDVKPSSAAGESLWARHRSFLATAAEKDVYVKLVITADLTEAELAETCSLIAEVRADIPLILQPVTPQGGCIPPKAEEALRMQERALRVLRDVRLIPQAHTMMGIR